MDQPAVLLTAQPAKAACAETGQQQHTGTDNNRTDDWAGDMHCSEALDTELSLEPASAQHGCKPSTAVLQDQHGLCPAGNAHAQHVDSPAADKEPTNQAAPAGSIAEPSTAVARLGGASEPSVISELAAALKQQQQPITPAAAAAQSLSTAFTELLERAARMQRVSPVQLALTAAAAAAMPSTAGLQEGTRPYMPHNSTESQAPPVGSTADLLQLFQGLVSSSSVLQGATVASAQAAIAVPAQFAAAASGPASHATLLATQPVPRQLPQLHKLMMRRSSDSMSLADPSTGPVMPGGNSALAAASPGALAAAAILMGLKPLALPRARAAGSAAVVPGVMKRKASSSLSTTPVCVLSPAGSAGLPDNIRPAGAAGGEGPAGHVLNFQVPMQTQDCFSDGAYLSAALPPAAAAAAGGRGSFGQSKGAIRRGRAGYSGLQEPSAWMDAELAATLAVYGDDRALPTMGTADATEDLDEDKLLQRAVANARQHRQHHVLEAAVAAAAAGSSGNRDSAEEDGDGMDVDAVDIVSPTVGAIVTMAAAAAALAGFADVEYRSTGDDSAGAHFFSPQKAGPMKGGYSPSKRMNGRKAMRVLDGDAEAAAGEAEGYEASYLFSGQHRPRSLSAPAQSGRTANKGVKPSAFAAADATSKQHQDAAAAAAAARLLAGSLVWPQHRYGRAAAPFDPAASDDDQQVQQILPHSQQQQFGIAGSPQPKGRGPAQLADHEQDYTTPRRHKPVPKVKKHEAEDEDDWKPRARPKGKAGAKPSPAKRRTPWLASPAKDATNDNSAAAVAQPQPDQSPGGSPIVAPGRGAPVTAAGRKGRKGGGGRSATSGFRGVTQHRYTQRWEAHLWDPDGVRNKTAGSNRTRGTQTYLGGYHTETEAARAYDRAALVYWGLQGFTNFPKEDYAGEMHLLSGLQRDQVVANIRAISHAMQRSVLRQLAVMPHQALPGVYEARLYDEAAPGAPSAGYKYLGAYPTTEAAQQAVTLAAQERQPAHAAAQAAVAAPDSMAQAAAVAAAAEAVAAATAAAVLAAPVGADGQPWAVGAINAVRTAGMFAVAHEGDDSAA